MFIKLLPRVRPGITPYRCDLTSDADIAGMFEWIEANPELGKVDVCIPNAGLAASSSLLEGTGLSAPRETRHRDLCCHQKWASLYDCPTYPFNLFIFRQSIRMARNERGQHHCPEPLHTTGSEVYDKSMYHADTF